MSQTCLLSTKREIELDTPPHLWMPLGCRADLAARLELWLWNLMDLLQEPPAEGMLRKYVKMIGLVN